ncbi:hypothetical protein ACSBR1_043303 [Camellia fascicularis]
MAEGRDGEGQRMAEGRSGEQQRMVGDAESDGDAKAARGDYCGDDEVKICGQETLAASHFLFTFALVNANKIEFPTLFGEGKT